MKEIVPPKKDKVNPFLKNKYADLGTVLESVKPVLEANGLMLIQPVGSGEPGVVTVISSIVHVETGQDLTFSATLKIKDGGGPQEAGSAITYLRRYSIMSLFALDAEDDDANDASGKFEPPSKASTGGKDAGQQPLAGAGSALRENMAKKLSGSLGGTFK